MNTKIIPAFLLVIVMGTGFIAYKFFSEKESLIKEKVELLDQNTVLINENNDLQNQYGMLQNEKFDLESRINIIQSELDRVQTESRSFKSRFEDVTRQRDELVQRLESGSPSVIQVASQPSSKEPISAKSDWVDFVEKKALVEAHLIDLKSKLSEAKVKISELDNNNKELNLKLGLYNRERTLILSQKKYKERALRVMSMDLVSEREQRALAVKEAIVLRSENIDLKRSIILANKQKVVLEKDLNKAIEIKESIEYRIASAENVLKEKSIIFSELKDQLEMAMLDGKSLEDADLTSVELPPIVVKPNIPGLRAVQGEIVAVNRDDKFVVVNIGEVTGVVPGTLLKVYRADKYIATLEVIETRKEICAADIKEVVGDYVIQQGDKVVNN
ncbi:MAG: hypothetical protein KAJ14_07830 [Candidatus Omnitrophica bacterium]|nr:hypothetical protein [Candidatus Omnitrophota bacterium]MCK5493003.1 hypothetical protein [Candidatus Omnitrophota bacterium]